MVMKDVIRTIIIGVVILVMPLSFFACTKKEDSRVQQKIIFCANGALPLTQGTDGSDCQEACEKHIHDINEFISNNWRVVSSSAKEVIETVPSSNWKRCSCIGTEYIIER